MDFGRLPDIRNTIFELPEDHVATAQVLARSQRPTKPSFYLGCPTWVNKDWLGSYYPAGAPDNQLLHWYGQQFNTLEMNTTYYRIPDLATVQKWKKAVPAGFTFCPKLPQIISHDQLLQNAALPTQGFCDAILELGDKLGRVFLQLPPFFGPDDFDILRQFLEQFPKEVPLAVEFRHPDWFKPGSVQEKTFTLLEELCMATVLTDVAGRRDVLHMRLTAPVAMIRFNGNSLHTTDYTRLEDWANRLHQWLEQGLHTVYFFMHQQEILHAPPALEFLMDQLEKRTGISFQRPKKLPQMIQGQLF